MSPVAEVSTIRISEANRHIRRVLKKKRPTFVGSSRYW